MRSRTILGMSAYADVVTSPASFATALLHSRVLEPAGGTAQVRETGSPRNDVTLGPRAQALRVAARRFLEVDDDRVVVMHAPVERRSLEPRDPVLRELDPDRLPERGRIDVYAERRTGRVRDVSGARVPLVALASDAAVLDYGPLRFDYLLQGKPMAFLVPDLAHHQETVGLALDHAATAAGPSTTSTAELAGIWDGMWGDRYAGIRQQLRRSYVDREHGDAAQRVASIILDLME